jgi:hypothetical protein
MAADGSLMFCNHEIADSPGSIRRWCREPRKNTPDVRHCNYLIVGASCVASAAKATTREEIMRTSFIIVSAALLLGTAVLAANAEGNKSSSTTNAPSAQKGQTKSGKTFEQCQAELTKKLGAAPRRSNGPEMQKCMAGN